MLSVNRDRNVELKYTIGTDTVTFDITADTTGYVALGFAYEAKHSTSVVYDSFVAGFKSGSGYIRSYKWEDTTMDYYPEERYSVSHDFDKII